MAECIWPECAINGEWGFWACEHSAPLEECETLKRERAKDKPLKPSQSVPDK